MAGEDQMRAVCSDFQGQVHGWDGPERFIKVSNTALQRNGSHSCIDTS